MDTGCTEHLLDVTAAERLEQLEKQRDLVKARTQGYDRIMEMATEEDLVRYFDRLKLFGEVAASEWLLNKYGAAK
jgi:hypothetical protein